MPYGSWLNIEATKGEVAPLLVNRSFPFAGITRIRFNGYDLSPSYFRHPLHKSSAKVSILRGMARKCGKRV
ncbi:hypothetical protein EL17_13720 [Anditalea andensis]|uniref:Uncharacterized protein n=1 Tax=Anditalea andensis TaxID=1048983 RepID=A0A074KWQ8_9BACT|nr:hypothetical protein EL17_13720 [Anditalea andensis]